jgi:hypothetical protein
MGNKEINFEKAQIMAPATHPIFTLTPTDPNITTKENANNSIGQYLSEARSINDIFHWNKNSFIFKDATADLSDFTNYISSAGITKVHFILAEDQYDNEIVYISCINSSGNHEYVKDQAQLSYVYKSNLNFATCENTYVYATSINALRPYVNCLTGLNQPSNPTIPDPGHAQFPDILKCTDAQNNIDRYCNDGSIINSPYSFLYDARELYSYINAARNRPAPAASIAALQFYLAESATGKLMMIIIGIDGQGNHIFLNDGTDNYVLDQCMPCPVCVTVNNSQQDVDNTMPSSFKLE